MKLLHEKSLISNKQNNFPSSKIECISWSGNGSKIAISNPSLAQIILFDGYSMEKKEKFSLKSASGAKIEAQTDNPDLIVSVKCIAFSLDCEKLAVGQSDSSIFVYKIGQQWGEKKGLVGKYVLQSPVMDLCWIKVGIIFATLDGKIKMIDNRGSGAKIVQIYSSEFSPIAISGKEDKILISFLDGSVILIQNLLSSLKKTIVLSPSPIVHFSICFASSSKGNEVVCAGSIDGRLHFLPISTSIASQQRQTIDLQNDIQTLAASPAGDVVLASSGQKMIIFSSRGEAGQWTKIQSLLLGNEIIPSVSRACFSPDGSQLLACTNVGSLEAFRMKWNQLKLAGGHEVTFVGQTQVNIRRAGQSPQVAALILRSVYRIEKLRLVSEEFIVGWTSASLIFGKLPEDLDVLEENNNSIASSVELLWNRSKIGLRFCFDFENVILIQSSGELHVIQWNTGDLLASIKVQIFSPHVLSVRLQERSFKRKALAYLLDVKTISILDLTNGEQLALISHDQQIDWLELNERADKLLFRDQQLNLSIFIIKEKEDEQTSTQVFNSLLSQCLFVQWVPFSDVIVAQSRDQLHIFYNSQQAQIHSLPGEVMAKSITRHEGKSWVQFTENYPDLLLNEALLEFDTALQDGDLARAMEYLERAEEDGSLNHKLQWSQLATEAVHRGNLLVAERAFAAAGDLVRSQFARHCANSPNDEPLLHGQFDKFERINDFEQVIHTYEKLRMWKEAIAFASKSQQVDRIEEMRSEYTQRLLSSGQLYEAALMAEQADQIRQAIDLYLQANQALSAARCVRQEALVNNTSNSLEESVVRKVINALEKQQFFEEAGELCELLPYFSSISKETASKQAMALFEQGEYFQHCLRIAREYYPGEVVRLEKKLGDQLLNRAQPAAAIAHFIEAGATQSALQAALTANQLERAAELAFALGESLNMDDGRKLATKLASAQLLEQAVNVLLMIGQQREAITMLNEQGQHSRAHALAVRSLPVEEVHEMYANIGKTLEKEQKWIEAEKVYLAANLHEEAISMYKKAHNYESMVRLVKQYHPELLNETRQHLAKELEAEGLLMEAESQYVAAGDWKQPINMYKDAGKWEDAYRLARSYGGQPTACQVAFLWARSLGNVNDAYQLLSRIGQVHPVLEIAMETGAFEFAASLTRQSPELKHKQLQVAMRWAGQLEQKGDLENAENLYLEAGRAREAIAMWLHASDYERALRLAESGVGGRDPAMLREVCGAYMRSLISQSSAALKRAAGKEVPADVEQVLRNIERLSLRAGKPEFCVNLLLQHEWNDRAAKFANAHAPHLLDAIKRAGHLTNNALQTSRPNSPLIISRPQSPLDPQSTLAQLTEQLHASARHGSREQLLASALRLAVGQAKHLQVVEALRTLHEYPALFLMSEPCKLLASIATELFAMDSGTEPSKDVLRLLRDALLAAQGGASDSKTLNTLASSSNPPEESLTQKLRKQMILSHFLLLRAELESLQKVTGTSELHLKLCISLLRYTDMVRVDKAFFQAGLACIDCGKMAFAFVFLNHFLDLVDAIEEGQLEVDHIQLEGTDIPQEVPLPSSIFCVGDTGKAYRFSGQPLPDSFSRVIEIQGEAEGFYSGQSLIEQVRAWILQKSMDTEEQFFELPKDKNGIFESNLQKFHEERSFCLVTGYPVSKDKQMELKAGKWWANKDDWNKLLMITKISASEQLKDCLQFIGRLCGSMAMARLNFQ